MKAKLKCKKREERDFHPRLPQSPAKLGPGPLVLVLTPPNASAPQRCRQGCHEPRGPPASPLRYQAPSSCSAHAPFWFSMLPVSRFQLLPQGLSPQLRHPHRPDPALGVDLLPGPAPLCPLHTPTLPLASLPLQGHSLGGLFLPLVGFLPPTKDCPGDRRTSELAIPSSRLC